MHLLQILATLLYLHCVCGVDDPSYELTFQAIQQSKVSIVSKLEQENGQNVNRYYIESNSQADFEQIEVAKNEFLPIESLDELVGVDGLQVSSKSFSDMMNAAAGTSEVFPLIEDGKSIKAFAKIEIFHPKVLSFLPKTQQRRDKMIKINKEKHTLSTTKEANEKASSEQEERARKLREHQMKLKKQQENMKLQIEQEKERQREVEERRKRQLGAQKVAEEEEMRRKRKEEDDRQRRQRIETSAKKNVKPPAPDELDLNPRATFLKFLDPPLFVNSTFMVDVAPWASQDKIGCMTSRMIASEPFDVCRNAEALKRLIAQQREKDRNELKLSMPIIVMGYRGGCSFIEKAQNVQEAGGDGLVVVNNKEGEGKFPEAEGSKDYGLKIPVLMLPKDKGEMLLGVLETSPSLFHYKSTPCRQFVDPFDKSQIWQSYKDKASHETPDFGKMMIWKKDSYEFVEYVPAAFGSEVEHVPIRVLAAVAPRHLACESGSLMLKGSGSTVLVMRGKCPFTTKARTVQATRARGMILINSEPGVFSMMSQNDQESEGIDIWGITIEKEAGEKLGNLIKQNGNHPTYVRIFPPNNSDGA